MIKSHTKTKYIEFQSKKKYIEFVNTNGENIKYKKSNRDVFIITNN